MADEGQEPKPVEGEEKPKKVYTLKDTPDGAGKRKKKVTPEPGAFGATCADCGKGLSTDGDKLCATCALAAAKKRMEPPKEPVTEPQGEPEMSFIDQMKEILTEIEKEQAVEDKVLEEVRAKFSVKDIPTANWVAGKIAMWQNEVERRKVQAKNYVGEAESTVKRLKFLFMAQLEAWAKDNCPQDKSHIKLPTATLKFTETQEKLEVENDQKAVSWATVNLPEAVKMSPVLSDLKDFWIASEKKTVPGGCTVIPKGTNFSVV